MNLWTPISCADSKTGIKNIRRKEAKQIFLVLIISPSTKLIEIKLV
jgi:hypothetical protein